MPFKSKAKTVEYENEVDGEVKLKREVGIMGGIAMIVGGMIGSGIFVSPVGIIRETESVGMSLVIWMLCGFLALGGEVPWIYHTDTNTYDNDENDKNNTCSNNNNDKKHYDDNNNANDSNDNNDRNKNNNNDNNNDKNYDDNNNANDSNDNNDISNNDNNNNDNENDDR